MQKECCYLNGKIRKFSGNCSGSSVSPLCSPLLNFQFSAPTPGLNGPEWPTPIRGRTPSPGEIGSVSRVVESPSLRQWSPNPAPRNTSRQAARQSTLRNTGTNQPSARSLEHRLPGKTGAKAALSRDQVAGGNSPAARTRQRYGSTI